jgi:hypothetical protein
MRVYKFLCAKFGMKSLREKRLKISTLDDLNDPFDLIPYEMTDYARRTAFRSWQSDLTRKYGVMCFSSEWCDPVIWAHYSDKHKGLCLGFDIPSEAARRVDYVDKRLPFPKNQQLLTGEALLFTKYSNWAYEKEVRCFATLDLTTKTDEGLFFMDFGEDLKLREVVAGARCELSEDEIRNAANPIQNVQLTKARAGFHRFEVVENKQGFSNSVKHY